MGFKLHVYGNTYAVLVVNVILIIDYILVLSLQNVSMVTTTTTSSTSCSTSVDGKNFSVLQT